MIYNLKIIFTVTLLLLIVSNNGYPYCFQEAGQLYGINPMVLRSIAKVESNTKPDTVNKNSNGTYDVGLMQINTIWKNTLGKERWSHLGDACYNTKTGAWILASCINKYGYNWKAIGCYNSQTPEKSEIYAKKVFNQLERLKNGKESQVLDKDMETAISAQIDELVQGIIPGDVPVAKKKAIKFISYTKLPKEKLLKPPPPPVGEPSVPVPLEW